MTLRIAWPTPKQKTTTSALLTIIIDYWLRNLPKRLSSLVIKEITQQILVRLEAITSLKTLLALIVQLKDKKKCKYSIISINGQIGSEEEEVCSLRKQIKTFGNKRSTHLQITLTTSSYNILSTY